MFIYLIKCSGLISINRAVFNFNIYFFFSFWSGFYLEATVEKKNRQSRGLKQFFAPCFLQNKFFSKIINN